MIPNLFCHVILGHDLLKQFSSIKLPVGVLNENWNDKNVQRRNIRMKQNYMEDTRFNNPYTFIMIKADGQRLFQNYL